MRTRFFAIAWLCVLVAGCAVLESTPDLAQDGLSYHLSKTILTVTVERKNGVYAIVTAENSVGDDARKKLIPSRADAVPDLNRRYVLKYNNNPFYHDRLCVAVDKLGLLQSIEVATEDATPEILLALAEFGAKVGSGGESAGDPRKMFAALPDTVITVTFDPFDKTERQAAERSISDRMGGIEIKLDLPDLRYLKGADASECAGRGVCFRSFVKTRLVLSVAGEIAATPAYFEVVNPTVRAMDIERAFLIEKIQRLGFTDGALTHVIVRKPSEALQAAKLPLAIVDTILAVPGNMLGRASGNSSAIKAEAEARKAALDSINTSMAAIQRDVSTRTETDEVRKSFQLSCKGALSKS